MTEPSRHHRDLRRLLQTIEAEARQTAQYTGIACLDAPVLDAIGRVPRHEFMPRASASVAYEDAACAIGCGQTISQPFIVALMTHLLEPRASDRILEIGTGSGYQAAVLSLLVEEVYSTEIIFELEHEAAARLDRLGYSNVHVRHADGFDGWPEHAPYDGIIVTAAAETVPPPLLAQLAPGGRLVIPVGPARGYQELMVVSRKETGEWNMRRVLAVAFVPLTRTHPDDED